MIEGIEVFKESKKKNQTNQKKNIGILIPKLYWPTVRKKNCSSDRGKLLKFEAEGREFAEFLKYEQFVPTVISFSSCQRIW